MSPIVLADKIENACVHEGCRCYSAREALRVPAAEVSRTPAPVGYLHFRQFLRVLHWQRPQAQGVQQLEDGGVRANAERKRQGGYKRENGVEAK